MMDKSTLLADLRNKLTPVKNYLAMQRDLDQQKGNAKDFLGGWNVASLEQTIKKEQIVAEQSFAKVELLIELLEKLP